MGGAAARHGRRRDELTGNSLGAIDDVESKKKISPDLSAASKIPGRRWRISAGVEVVVGSAIV